MRNSDMPMAPLTNEYGYPLNARTLEKDECQRTMGLTKREYFAGLMMQAEKIHHGAKGDYSWSSTRAAEDAVRSADALLEELGKI